MGRRGLPKTKRRHLITDMKKPGFPRPLGKSVERLPDGQLLRALEAKIPSGGIFCWGFLFFGFQIMALAICINRLNQHLAVSRAFLCVPLSAAKGLLRSRLQPADLYRAA